MNSETLFAVFAILAAAAVFALLVAGVFLMIRDTRRQSGRWGINLSAPFCRACRAPFPPVRVPANFRQAVWGGWTCTQCGVEVDKWGEPIPK